MLDVLEKLLVLQDRDRKIAYLQAELESLVPQRQRIQSTATNSQTASESAKLHGRHLEADRKKLELEVDSLKQQIERYSLQQFQTKKNDEYRALAHEIEMARDSIVKLEDRQLELMEQSEAAQRLAVDAARTADATRKTCAHDLAELDAREQNLKKELARLEADRCQIGTQVDPSVLPLYERLRRNKGDKVIVGIDHGCCGGCHMRLPAQLLIVCQANQEIPTCINCGRILYYTQDMNLAAAE